jgi:hypothetical protein
MGVVTGRRTLSWRAWPPFGLLLAALAVTTVTSQDALTSATGFVRYAELFVLIPVAVAAAVRDRLDVLLVAGTVIAVASLEGAVGAWQYLTATGASFGGQGIRAVGTFGAADVMGMAIVVALGMVVALALALTRRGRARVMLLAVAAALVVPLAFSLSRGTWIAVAVAVVAVAVVCRLARAGRRNGGRARRHGHSDRRPRRRIRNAGRARGEHRAGGGSDRSVRL